MVLGREKSVVVVFYREREPVELMHALRDWRKWWIAMKGREALE